MLDSDGPQMWWGPLPGPIARRIFLDRMYEKHGETCLPEIRDLEILSALARGDEETAEIYYVDTLAAQKGRTVVRISKFSPGEHFYVGREKFVTLEEAQKHAERLGYLVLPGLDVQSMNDLILAARAARMGV
jgi:hypothetical protein